MYLKVTKLYFFKNISGSDVLPVQPGLPPLPLVLIREVWCLSLSVIWTFLCESFLLSFSQSKYKSPIKWQVKAQGRQGEGNQSRNLLAIWSNWLFAVFAGWEAEHILYGLSCYGGWSHPPILDPRCRSPWLRAPSPAWHSCGLLGGAPSSLDAHCRGDSPGWDLSGKLQGLLREEETLAPSQKPSLPPPTPPYFLLPKRSFSWSTRDLFSYSKEKDSSLPRGKFLAFLEIYRTGSSLWGLI